MSTMFVVHAREQSARVLDPQARRKRKLDELEAFSSSHSRPLKATKHSALSTNPMQAVKHTLQAEPIAKKRSSDAMHDARAYQGCVNSQKTSHSIDCEGASCVQSLRPRYREDFVPATYLTTNTEVKFLKKRKVSHNKSDEDFSRQRLVANIHARMLKRPKNHMKLYGFPNPGNYCYRRSVTQSFMHSPIFAGWLEDACASKICNHDSRQFCLSCGLLNLIKAARSGSGRDVAKSIGNLDMGIRRSGSGSTYDWTRNAQQADASEFVLFVVQKLLEGSEPLDSHITKTLKGIFQTQLVSEWKCQDCGEYSTGTPVDETLLSVSIISKSNHQWKQPASLQECLDHFFVETLPGVNCERCGSKRDRRRSLKINAAPVNLYLQLKRFSFAIGGSKMKAKVSYPETLDLGRYMMNTPLDGGSLKYKLGSVVAHVGSLRGGHYITYARSAGKVYKFDDLSVSECPMKEMLDPQHDRTGFGAFTPYILSYIRSD